MIAIGNINPDLTEVEKRIVVAFKQPTVVSLWKQDVENLRVNVILPMINKVCLAAGQANMSQLEKANLVNELILSCLNTFPSVTIAEFETYLNSGVRGEFGEFYGLNVTTIHKWIKSGLKEQKRIDSIKKQIEYEAELNAYSNLDADKINAEFWEKEKIRLEKFQKSGELDIHSPRLHLSVYEEAGKIKLTKDEKWDLYNSEMEKYIYELTRKAFLPHQREAWKAHKAEVIRFETGELLPEDKATIVQRACLTALKEYFINL